MKQRLLVNALAGSILLFLQTPSAAQQHDLSTLLSFGLERYAGDYLWYENSRGYNLGIQVNRQMYKGFNLGLGLSHHFVTQGPSRGYIIDVNPYLHIIEQDVYAYQTEADLARLEQHGVFKFKDRMDKLSYFKCELTLSYDLLKSRHHDLEVRVGGNLNYASTTEQTDNWAGQFASEGLESKFVRYVVPYEQRAFGVGYTYSLGYSYAFQNDLLLGLRLERNEINSTNGGTYHSVNLLIGKKFGKNGKTQPLKTSSAAEKAQYSLQGGFSSGYSNIDNRRPGFGLNLGVNNQFNERWSVRLGFNSFFAESDGGFENPENLPYLVNNVSDSNPLWNFFIPDNFTGWAQLPTYFNRHFILSGNVTVGYDFLRKEKHRFTLFAGPGLHYVDIIHADCFLRGSYDATISGTDDAWFPVYRYQRYVDIGVAAGVRYTWQMSQLLDLQIGLSENYMPKSGNNQVLLTVGAGIKI